MDPLGLNYRALRGAICELCRSDTLLDYLRNPSSYGCTITEPEFTPVRFAAQNNWFELVCPATLYGVGDGNSQGS